VTPNRHGPAIIEFPDDLEVLIIRPTRSAQTWLFDRWPDAHAVESMTLREAHGVTKVTYSLAFRDQAARDHMTKFDGLVANFDNVEDRLRSLLDPKGTVPG
jgi:hypothetical protein